MERGQRFAEVADVIFFGGSFIRFGVRQEPFFARHVLPYNFAVTGGGSNASYYQLKSIEDKLRRRDKTPVLVLEMVDVRLVD